jgi:hypothetical protein
MGFTSRTRDSNVAWAGNGVAPTALEVKPNFSLQQGSVRTGLASVFLLQEKLTCDPVGGLVQIPCIERDTMWSTWENHEETSEGGPAVNLVDC